MLVRQILLAVIGLSCGVVVAGGLFAFIVALGVISDFADRTHTGAQVTLYEDVLALGGILGNIVQIYGIQLPFGSVFLGAFGLFSGIFVGCWSIALTEILNVFPIFTRRAKVIKGIPYFILSVAIGKGIGALIFFFNGW